MTHDELARIAQRYETSMADAMLRALGVKRKHQAKVSKNRGRYKGAKKLMRQRYGVRL